MFLYEFKEARKNGLNFNGQAYLVTFPVLVSRFKKQSWLIPNLKTWKTFDDEDGEQDALKFILEDL